MNPAVTLAVVISGGLNCKRLIPYWISQLLGGITGAALPKVRQIHIKHNGIEWNIS